LIGCLSNNRVTNFVKLQDWIYMAVFFELTVAYHGLLLPLSNYT